MTPEELTKFETLTGNEFWRDGIQDFGWKSSDGEELMVRLIADWYRGKELREAAEEILPHNIVEYPNVKNFTGFQQATYDLEEALQAFIPKVKS